MGLYHQLEFHGQYVAALLARFAQMLPVMAYLVFCARLYQMRHLAKPESSREWIKADFKAIFSDPHRLPNAVIGFGLTLVIMLSLG